MDEFDFIEEKPRRRFRLGAALLNLLSLGLVLATLAVGAFALYIFFDPFSPYNPLPPISPTSEPSPTSEIVLLEAEQATETPLPTETATPSPSATPTRAPGAFFELQEGNPAALDASVFHPELGCNFMGVAGQAFGLDDAPVPDLIVHISGTLGGEDIDKVGLTGAATVYGAGSYYEVELATEPIASDETLEITLRDEDGEAISGSYPFSTFDSCEENIIFINFVAIP